MQKNSNEYPKRAQSLQLYKKPNTIELPRFHSKPKNISSPYLEEIKKSENQSNRKTKITNKFNAQANKKKIANIVSKLKFRKKEQNLQRKPVSEKKMNSNPIVQGQQQNQHIKINFKLAQNKQEEGEKSSQVKKQFRSKSLKNSVKIREPMIEQLKGETEKKKKSKKIITQEIIKEQRIQNKKKQYITQMQTEPTQNYSSVEGDKGVWVRIIEIFKNITIDPGNLDWPEEYIVMEKFTIQKRLYQSLNGPETSKIKEKVKKHICLTRISIYLYANLILDQVDCKSLMGLFERIKDSFHIIFRFTFKDKFQLPKDILVGLNRNNEFNLKTLLTILSKRKIPHNALLKNMLESSLKIDSIEFIEILDKTLKWQILKMPSYPYLPAAQKDKHLVLDLDETLVHYDYKGEVFHVRPFAEEFLKKVSKVFQITIFTAATQEYADEILQQIDPENCINYKLYRNHLTYLENIPLKDLSMLGRPLNKTIIVDNLCNNYRLQPTNGIQILSWYHDDEDDILGKLYALLLKIVSGFEDFRMGIKHYEQFIREEITRNEVIYEMKEEL